MQNYIKQRTI